MINILDGFQGSVILHWYSGSIKELQVAIEREYYFSINHQMIRSNVGRNIINLIPMNKILIESDAPFTCGLKDKYDLDNAVSVSLITLNTDVLILSKNLQ